MDTKQTWDLISMNDTEAPVNREFSVLRTERDLRPMKGFDEPTGPVVTVRAFPGNVFAWGRDTNEAASNLAHTLNALVGTRSLSAWFAEAEILAPVPEGVDRKFWEEKDA